MILHEGKFFGRGSLVTDHSSLGIPVNVQVALEQGNDGLIINGEFTVGDEQEELRTHAISGTIRANDHGQYDLYLRSGPLQLEGRAKLQALPASALCWDDETKTQVALTLFPFEKGYAIRSISRRDNHSYSFEVTLQPLKSTAAAPEGRSNVVTLRPR